MTAEVPPVAVERRKTRRIAVGQVVIGGGAPVSVQTMTKTDTRDVAATRAQIASVARSGCDIVRLAVVDADAAAALRAIVRESPLPLIADIHFDHRLALAAIDAGVQGLRLNPGNISDRTRIAEVAGAAAGRGIPIRIGVNAGSVERDLLERHGGATAQALVESAMRHVRILEDLQFTAIKVSVKASDVRRTVEAYRLLSRTVDYPLHLGVTEAGTLLPGTVRSAVAMGILLAEGIGDTIRVSLTDAPEQEVKVGLEILRSLGLRRAGPAITSCPTCGRIEVGVVQIAATVEQALEAYALEHPDRALPHVAVMGCMVNGPGEAREADLALAGGRHKFALYRRGQLVETVAEADAIRRLMQLVSEWR